MKRLSLIALLLAALPAAAQTPEQTLAQLEDTNRNLIIERDRLISQRSAEGESISDKIERIQRERDLAREACVDGISVKDLETIKNLAGGTIATSAVSAAAGTVGILDQANVINKDKSGDVKTKVTSDGALRGTTNLGVATSVVGIASGAGSITMSAIAQSVLSKQRDSIDACKNAFRNGEY